MIYQMLTVTALLHRRKHVPRLLRSNQDLSTFLLSQNIPEQVLPMGNVRDDDIHHNIDHSGSPHADLPVHPL